MNKVEGHSIRYGINLLELLKILRLRLNVKKCHQIYSNKVARRVMHSYKCTMINVK